MGLINEIKANFKTKDLYQVLDTSKAADEKQLKKAYYKASLKVHPDRVSPEEKESSTIKFQILGKVYSILSDVDKRAVYDETGEIDDGNLPEEENWDQYWRRSFKKISVDDIKNFEEQYKGSEEELDDLQQAYVDGKGDMDFILENVLCASVDDEERFSDVIKDWISKKTVEDFSKFSEPTKTKQASRKRKAAREAKEAETLMQELGMDDSEQSLRQLILKRGQKRVTNMDSFLDQLTSKYVTDKKAKGKNKAKK